MKVYIAGPMRGYPQFNFPAFYAAARKLRRKGHTVFNPAERDVKKHGIQIANSRTGNLKTAIKKGFSLRDALAADTNWICRYADAVYLLPGWKASKGACAERALAKALGLKVVYLRKAA